MKTRNILRLELAWIQERLTSSQPFKEDWQRLKRVQCVRLHKSTLANSFWSYLWPFRLHDEERLRQLIFAAARRQANFTSRYSQRGAASFSFLSLARSFDFQEGTRTSFEQPRQPESLDIKAKAAARLKARVIMRKHSDKAIAETMARTKAAQPDKTVSVQPFPPKWTLTTYRSKFVFWIDFFRTILKAYFLDHRLWGRGLSCDERFQSRRSFGH